MKTKLTQNAFGHRLEDHSDAEGHFELAVHKIGQLRALLEAIRKSADPACSSDGLEAVTLGELVGVADSVLDDADAALSDYRDVVAGQSPMSVPAKIVLPVSESGQSDLDKSQKVRRISSQQRRWRSYFETTPRSQKSASTP